MKGKLLKYKSYLTDLFLVIVILLLILFFSNYSDSFISKEQFINLANIVSYRLIISLAMGFVFATGGIDLSGSSMISLGAIIIATLLKKSISFLPSILISSLAIGALGGLNGYIIHKTKINAFIITLATSLIIGGLGLVITKGVPISRFPKEILAIGSSNKLLSPSVIISLVILILSIIFGYHTKWGLYIRMIGSSEHNLRRTGVNTAIYQISVYVFMGIAATIVGLILMTKLNSAEVNLGGSLGIDAITAVILGGSTLKGGEFKITGTVLSVFLLSITRLGLTATSVSSYYQDLVVGIILLIAVLIANLWNKNIK